VPTDGQLHVRFTDGQLPLDRRGRARILRHPVPRETGFRWYALDATQPKYLFRGKVTKTFSLTGTLALAGGTNAVEDLAINTRYRLNDPVGTVQATYDALSLDLRRWAIATCPSAPPSQSLRPPPSRKAFIKSMPTWITGQRQRGQREQ
jgi:hypothetical protein